MGSAALTLLSGWETEVVRVAEVAEVAEVVVGIPACPKTSVLGSAATVAVAAVAASAVRTGCRTVRNSVVAEVAAVADIELVGHSPAVVAPLPAADTGFVGPVLRTDCRSSFAGSPAAVRRS